MFLIALLLYILFLAVYWFFVFSVLWHVKEYTIPQDSSRWVIWIFLGAIIVLNLLSLGLFFNLPIR